MQKNIFQGGNTGNDTEETVSGAEDTDAADGSDTGAPTSNAASQRPPYQAQQYDPNNSKRKKRTAAEIQAEDTEMKKKMCDGFMETLKTVSEQEEEEDEHSSFAKAMVVQMRLVN